MEADDEIAYALLDEAMNFSPQTGEVWILSYDVRHWFYNWVRMHVYRSGGHVHLRVMEVVNARDSQLLDSHHTLLDAEAEGFEAELRHLLDALPFSLASESYVRDGCRHWLKVQADTVHSFQWEYPSFNFERVQPILDRMMRIGNVSS